MPAEQIVTTFSHYLAVLHECGVVSHAPDDRAAATLPISWVSCDSRDVRPSTLFVCKGAAFKPAYLEAAIAAGAVAYVAQEPYNVDIPGIVVNDIRTALGVLADTAYDHPSGALAVCAVTGTKGKTTTAYYLRSILDAQAAHDGRVPTPLFSTIMLDDGVSAQPSALTTPEPLDLQRHLGNARSVGAREVVMEASSQALKYGRVTGVEFAVGAFLNIGEDHISPIEHPTFEDYFASKLLLFAQCETAVVNIGADRASQTLFEAACTRRALDAARACTRTITYSLHDADASVHAENIRRMGGQMAFTAVTPRFSVDIVLPTMGSYNVENALTAIACAEARGVEAACIAEGLARATVPGRMEIVPGPTKDLVGIVDYAHNGPSLEALLKDVRESYPNRTLAVVFGATGTKGVERRIGMGHAAGRLADRLFVTEDDPGTEDVRAICDTIAACAQEEGNDDCTVIVDREQAVRAALASVDGPTVLVLAGKGHERRMMREKGYPYEGDAPLLRRLFSELA